MSDPDHMGFALRSSAMSVGAVRQTHQLHRDGDLITKTYRSWRRGEHRREWDTLSLLALHQPGLAPRPVTARLDAQPPSLTMTVLPGSPIVGRWTTEQVELLAETMSRLWAVPCHGMPVSEGLHPAYWRDLAAVSPRPSGGAEQEAYDWAVGWIDGPELDALLDGNHEQILGQGDPQPGNMLYDGTALRLVDFEDAGASDVCFELANFAEHLGARDAGLARLADLIEHDDRRYRKCRALIASYWLFRLLPDPAGLRTPRPSELHQQALRLIDLVNGSS